MSQNTKKHLIRKALITGFFTVEFSLAFFGIVLGCMPLYALMAVTGVVVPALAGATINE